MNDNDLHGLARMNALAKQLLEDESYYKLPNLRPKDAATLILIDHSGPISKVLLGKRHHGHKFMPGKYVFPGGGVEPADHHMPTAQPLDRHAEQRLMRAVKRPSPVRARALALAAIRETYEETGLLLGAPANDMSEAAAGPWAAFTRAQILPDLTAIHFVARAITPPRRPKRFDTRFFAADAGTIARRIARGRAGRAGLDADRAGAATRHAGDHSGRAGRARNADRRRARPRSAGSVLPDAPSSLRTGIAVRQIRVSRLRVSCHCVS
jgi:8-oxo-dGTP pyrophosphatase MutT (NUDIX family)